MVDLLAQRHEQGRRFHPTELVERGVRVAVGFEHGGFKVVTFGGPDDRAVLLEDCAGRDDALSMLDSG